MAGNKKTRDELKSYFEPCATPSAREFCDLIDAFLHTEEDDLHCNNLTVQGAEGFDNAGETATLSLGDENHYIKSEHGKGVTIGTFDDSGDDKHIIHLAQDEGNVGIGTDSPSCRLDVQGDVCISGQLTVPSINVSGMGMIPVGGIIMWSGTNIPSGWALCDGGAGTPDLSEKFVVGYNPSAPSGDYGNPGNRSEGGTDQGNIGGTHQQSVTLSKANIPPHNHSGGDLKTDTDIHGHKVYTRGSGDAVDQHRDIRHGRRDDRTLSNPTTDYNTDKYSHNHQITGNTGNGNTDGLIGSPFTFDNRSLFYVIAFIMKL